ncbi:hypothetical protein IFM89_009687 [Coptis chinensis]|uniref:Uncharacterized protein n=1 Tax=Coptis chinensis TaxID=261450 RepID=A0A835IL98_9MAGN|nr:hypothetical protein IFM89_009687 [Coptis chinensis]
MQIGRWRSLRRTALPETTAKKGADYPVTPIVLAFSVFVVIGSCELFPLFNFNITVNLSFIVEFFVLWGILFRLILLFRETEKAWVGDILRFLGLRDKNITGQLQIVLEGQPHSPILIHKHALLTISARAWTNFKADLEHRPSLGILKFYRLEFRSR